MNNGLLSGSRFLTLRLHMNQLKAAGIEGNKNSSRRQIAVISKRRDKVSGKYKIQNTLSTALILKR